MQTSILPNAWVRADLQAPYTAEERSGQPDAYEVAAARLEHALKMLRELEISAEAEVGDDNPLHPVEDFLRDHGVDEVVVSTLPRHLSHWLRLDLPSRIHRRFEQPVTTVTAKVSKPTTA